MGEQRRRIIYKTPENPDGEITVLVIPPFDPRQRKEVTARFQEGTHYSNPYRRLDWNGEVDLETPDLEKTRADSVTVLASDLGRFVAATVSVGGVPVERVETYEPQPLAANSDY